MNALTFPILKLLADGKFHSGEDIARHFNVSRTSVWNALQHAEQLFFLCKGVAINYRSQSRYWMNNPY